MKTFKRIGLLLLIIIVVFIGNTLWSSGCFRTIEPKFDGNILLKVPLKGAEDIMISRVDSFALISSTDRLESRNPDQKGGLFLIDLKTRDFTPIPLSNSFDLPFAPHGISFFKLDSTYRVMAINHANNKHSIEVFELNGRNLRHIQTLRDDSMINPNDLVMLDANRFYYTNDHKYMKGFKRTVEEFGGLAISNVVYYDGQKYSEVADGIAYANGINYDKKRNLLFVASPRGFLVKVYSKNEDGSLSFIEDIPCGTGVDNIEFDQQGNLWIGGHPDLLHFSAYRKGKKDISPSEIIKIEYRSKGDYTIEKIYVGDGRNMSASTVAATFGNLIFTGNVMDDKFLILERTNSN